MPRFIFNYSLKYNGVLRLRRIRFKRQRTGSTVRPSPYWRNTLTRRKSRSFTS